MWNVKDYGVWVNILEILETLGPITDFVKKFQYQPDQLSYSLEPHSGILWTHIQYDIGKVQGADKTATHGGFHVITVTLIP